MRILVQGAVVGLRMFISSKFPSDATAVGSQSPFE